ncbi:MAG: hypothetical protein K2P09_04520 [Erysipelotrichales bacterium]|nr:hypothetical protein [Erysipelotrichales bacterium]
MNKEIKKYIKNIKIMFPIMQKEEKKYIERIKQSIIKQSESQGMSYQDLVNQFGLPDDIMKAYIDEIDSDEFISKIKKHRTIKKFIVGTCVFIVMSVLIVSLWNIHQINEIKRDFRNHVPVEYQEEIEVIE